MSLLRPFYKPLFFVVVMLLGLGLFAVHAQDETVERPRYTLTEEEVTYPSGDITLSGLLLLPETEPPFPAVVVVHGSGRARFDVYRPFAERVAVYGVAVLVYDKRGVGGSEGTYSNVGSSNAEDMIPLLAGDALAGVEYLRGREDINPDQVGLMGSSQAGWIIPEAVSQSDDVAFMVNLVSPTVSVGQEMYYSGLTGGRDDINQDNAALSERMQNFSGRAGYDPLPALQAIEIPGLWMLGGRDSSIPVPETIAVLDTLIADGKPYTVVFYPYGNHSLYDLQTEAFINYTPEMMDWVFAQLEAEDTPSD